MSLSLLTSDELASFLLGQAFRKAMLNGTRDARDLRAQAWAAYEMLLGNVMDRDEATFITRTTGLIDLDAQWDARDTSWK